MRKQQTLAIQPITPLKSHVGPSLPCVESTPLPNKTLNLKTKKQKTKKSDKLPAAGQNPSRRQQMIKSFPPHLFFFINCVTHSTSANFWSINQRRTMTVFRSLGRAIQTMMRICQTFRACRRETITQMPSDMYTYTLYCLLLFMNIDTGTDFPLQVCVQNWQNDVPLMC